MKSGNSLSWALLVVLLLSTSACKTKPQLDVDYQPQDYELSGGGLETEGNFSDNQTTRANSIYDDIEPIKTESWFTGTAPAPASAVDFGIEEIKDRRWGPVYFAFNQSLIGETERQKLEKLADYLIRNSEYFLIIEGHCDARGSDEFNRVLGEQRGINVRDYLVNLGVNSTRVQTISYGEERLIDRGDNEKAHARNRRAEFIVGLKKN